MTTMRATTITPKMASEWLKLNTKNRPFSAAWAKALAETITDEEWRLNGETIKFSKNGTLLDGQHRLQAIIAADKPAESYVIRGLDDDVYGTIDRNRRRTLSHDLARSGEKHYVNLAQAVRVVHEWEWNGRKNIVRLQRGQGETLTTDKAEDLLRRHPKIRNSVELLFLAGIRKVMSPGLACGVHYICTKYDTQEAADEFWVGIATGEGLKSSQSCYLLRERILADRVSKTPLGREAMRNLIVQAWNKRNDRCRAKSLRVPADTVNFTRKKKGGKK